MNKTIPTVIVNNMTNKEIYNSIIKIDSFLNQRLIGWSKKYKKIIDKKSNSDAVVLDYLKIAPNLYTILIVAGQHDNLAFGKIYVFLQNDKWVAADILSTTRSKNGLIIYNNHFFVRYKERMNIDKSGIDLIFHYFKMNYICSLEQENYTHNNKEHQITFVKEGGIIVDIVEDANIETRYMKTFISNEMLKNKQIELRASSIMNNVENGKEYVQYILN
jgi:hypothetical protein